MTIPDPGAPYGLKTTLKVGMEIHVELDTRSKMWTDAPNVAHPDYLDSEPNTLLSPVVIGMPGTLPVINEQAVEMSILVGLALNCEIAKHTKWDRKSYWYPDLPKNYQISQYDQPICGEGFIDIPAKPGDEPQGESPDGLKRIRITRAHLEEDAGKLLHELPGGGFCDGSLVDLNRAGTPLLEIVTEPDFDSADQAVTFGQMLRDICRHLGVTQGVMQKGHMRFEPNINVLIEKDGETFKTPVVEIKNLNSFKAVHGAILHEHERQVEQWLADGKVMGARAKSTRGWDDVNLVTTPQREKEDADEYRYFPDPDLCEVEVTDEMMDRVKAKMVELPLSRRRRYVDELGLKQNDAQSILDEPATTRFYEAILACGADAISTAKLLRNNLSKLANEKGVLPDALGVSPAQVADVVSLTKSNKVGSSAVDKLLALCAESDGSAESLADANGLMQVTDDNALEAWVDEVLANPKMQKSVDDVKAGKDKAINALLGQVMRLSKGSANPQAVTAMIKGKLQG
ncbi:MAG: Asp-tRNA(Asn)/Glu-tRNA(Gln) amidotransferase subunit GatB [Phycisphaeraceae bacterium]